MQLIDTHCHIHEPSYAFSAEETLKRARESGVKKLICVGTSEVSSQQALQFAAAHEGVFASVGVHPHDTKDGWESVGTLIAEASLLHLQNGFAPGLIGAPAPDQTRAADVLTNEARKPTPLPATADVLLREKASTSLNLVAIGEIGLDYFYTHSPREVQIKALEEQLQLALDYNLPVIFHVREAFEDFWPIFDNFRGIKGELHSFTDTMQNMEQTLKRGLFIGVNGISTFTKSEEQKAMFAAIPLEKLLLETDAPFLTPSPFRGKVNEPAFVRQVAEHHARIRGLSLEEVAATTSINAETLFSV